MEKRNLDLLNVNVYQRLNQLTALFMFIEQVLQLLNCLQVK